MVCAPLAALLAFQRYDMLVELPVLLTVPSMYRVTPATPTLSLLFTLMVTCPLTFAPLAGLLIVTAGGVVSTLTVVVVPVLETVKITGFELATLPAASNACAASVTLPFATFVESQLNA